MRRLLALLAVFALAAGCESSIFVPIDPGPGPILPPPIDPPPPVDPPPPPAGDLPAVGSERATVEAAWGAGTDLPENPGEDDAVSYIRTLGGREAEIHVIYRGGKVHRVVYSYLVTPGGG